MRLRPPDLAVAAWVAAIALLLLLAATTAPPEGPGELYERALGAYRAGEARRALTILEPALVMAPEDPGLWTLRGWILLRLGRVDDADGSFGRALEMDAGSSEARTGRGHVALRRERAGEALALFEEALRRSPAAGDAARGRARALFLVGRVDEAREALAPLLKAAPGDPELRELARLLKEDAPPPVREARPRPGPADPSLPLRVAARAGRTYLETPSGDGSFRPIFVKGVNLGVALPGRFPAQFPVDAALYHEWLDLIAGMNANVVRLYTLLPPAFYAALAVHKEEHPDRALWLIQGVWAELPPEHDFDDPEFKDELHAEMARVIDAYHGNLDVPPRPGHASGRYRADVSDRVLAIILGREWEPSSVAKFDRAHPGEGPFRGEFAVLEAGTATERWLAWLCDATVGYETERYREQRPVAFTNWPTLDPLRHPTESTHEETNAWLRSRGEAEEEAEDTDWNEDGVAVDPERMRPAAGNRAGFFASYHIYPYYPDFMNLDPGYQEARGAEGPSPYIGYLRELVAHHAAQPLLVSELGVPTSRGVAHVHPLGWNHGGHTARAQGEIDARLMREVQEAGTAGGVLFAWLDEWFKRNWLVQRFELPRVRNPLWHNVMDPEQNYGILGAWAGPAEGGHRLDGDASEWAGLEGSVVRTFGARNGAAGGCDAPGRIVRLGVAADAAYLHLLFELDGADCDDDPGIDWGRLVIVAGIDTHGDEAGNRRLAPGDAPLPTGVEFRIRLGGPGESAAEVNPSYDIGTFQPMGPFVSRPRDDGVFRSTVVVPNRRRFGRDGTAYPSVTWDHSPLRFVSEGDGVPPDAAASARGSTGVVEVRLPWGLLNFTDPSSHRVLDHPERGLRYGTATTDRVIVYATLRDAEGAEIDRVDSGPFLWDRWEEPVYHLALKGSYDILRRAFAGLDVGEDR